ncbi:MAG: lectin like domain-containing protein [Trichodesmium sp.]
MDVFNQKANNLGLEFTDPMLAGINGAEASNQLRFASGIESSAESSELKIEYIDTGNDDLLLSQNDLGTLGVNKSEKSLEKTSIEKEDPLIGQGNNVVEEVDPLTGETSNEVEIQRRSGKKRDKAGNNRRKAYNFGVLNDDEKLKEFVGRSDRKDFYKFRVKEKTDVDIELRGLSGNADLYLLNNKGKVIEKSVKGGKKVEDIERTLNPGSYYVRVQSKGKANANYTLSLDGELPDMAGNNMNKAHNLGVLKDDEKLQEFVGKSDKKDFYKFRVKEKTDVDIELRGLSGNADLYLLNNKGKVIEKSVKGGKKVEDIERTLNPGSYYVRVQSKGKANANYTLSLDAAKALDSDTQARLMSVPIREPVVQDNPFAPPFQALNLPSSYDLRTEGDVTPVKNQGGCGSCWAFATYASLESSILKEKNLTTDFSENHLKNYHGFDWGPCDGGTHNLSIAYLSRGEGPVKESDDPYNAYDDRPSPGGTPPYYAREISILNTDDEMKQALMEQGALYVTMHYDGDYLNESSDTYYYSGSKGGNHAVALVGWDDNKAVPGVNKKGAWLCKNSWGSGFGNNGYFWISYQDTKGVNYGVSFNDATVASSFNNIYYHDEFGQIATFGAPYALNAFTAKENEALSAIGFYTQADSARYNIKVYDDFSNGQPSRLLAEKSGNATYAGYHTVDLNSSVNLKAGDDFYIYLQIENGGEHPQAIDYRHNGYSSDSTARKGESYYSNNGKTWTDLTTWNSTANFSIKALTTESAKPTGSITVNSPNGGNTLEPGKSYTITWDDNINENVKLELYKGGSFNRTIASSTQSDGSYSWTVPASITNGSNYKVKITSTSNNSVSDFSNSNFTIKSTTSDASTSRVLLADTFDEGNISHEPNISDDGRYISFISLANNLVPGDTNGSYDVFVRDIKTGSNTRVSVASDGTQGNNDSSYYQTPPVMSSDGRYVAFSSDANNLVPGDTNGTEDVFLHDTQTGTTTRVSVSSNGIQSNGESDSPAISSNGRYVVFESDASNLVSGDTNSEKDVFVHDTQTGSTTRASVATNGTQGNSTSFSSTISDDGRYVAFTSWADNLVSGDTNSLMDVFVHDTLTGSTTRVSVATDGTQGNDRGYWSSISGDGNHVLFMSYSSNLVSGDTNGNQDFYEGNDVFVRNIKTGTTTRVSVGSNGTQANSGSIPVDISRDGRYVVFQSEASNLVSGDTNGVDDVFLRDTLTGTTTRVSVAQNGTQGNGNSEGHSISSNGRYVVFTSDGSNLVSGDNNNEADVFLYDRGL